MIWPLVKRAWPRDQLEWPRITIGLILGYGLIASKNQDEQNNPNEPTHERRGKRGASRLATILISKAAHLIWVLRCERVIRDKNHSDSEIATHWKNVINTRLTNDKIITTRIKRESNFTILVKNTWEQILRKEGPLPHDWINNRKVLVGSRPQHAPMEDPVS